jgi:hypothetical protein
MVTQPQPTTEPHYLRVAHFSAFPIRVKPQLLQGISLSGRLSSYITQTHPGAARLSIYTRNLSRMKQAAAADRTPCSYLPLSTDRETLHATE